MTFSNPSAKKKNCTDSALTDYYLFAKVFILYYYYVHNYSKITFHLIQGPTGFISIEPDFPLHIFDAKIHHNA